MPIKGDRVPFQTGEINKAPVKPGAFQLLSRGKTIFYGWAGPEGLRNKLREHYTGKHGSCTKIATGFKFELHEEPEKRCAQLLTEYEKKNGEAPRCNQ